MKLKMYAAVIPQITLSKQEAFLITGRLEIQDVMRGFFDSGEALATIYSFCVTNEEDAKLGKNMIDGYVLFDGDQDFLLSGVLLPIEREDETEWFWISWESQWIRDQDHKEGTESEWEVETTGTQVSGELGHYINVAVKLWQASRA